MPLPNAKAMNLIHKYVNKEKSVPDWVDALLKETIALGPKAPSRPPPNRSRSSRDTDEIVDDDPKEDSSLSDSESGLFADRLILLILRFVLLILLVATPTRATRSSTMRAKTTTRTSRAQRES